MVIKYRYQLPDLMRELKLPLIAVEIGVAQGLFSLDLVQAGIQKLYLVDRWECTPNQKGDASESQQWHDKNYWNVTDKFKFMPEKIVILKGNSPDMAKEIPDNETLGLVYIDGDHSYEGVMADIEAWYPKLIPGGIMAFHDYENVDAYGVQKAVKEFCIKNGYTEEEIINIPENHPDDAGAYFIKY